jgi:phosphatidylinositol alpha-1,6-mannosyltransferase
VNIVMPTADYPPIEGGISTVALHLSRELARQGHQVTVIAPYFYGQKASDSAEPVTLVRYRGYNLGWLRLFPMCVTAWPHLAKADLVVGINVAYGGLLGWLARRLRRTPYVTFGYAYEFLKFKSTPLVAGLLRRIYANAQLVVAISGFTRDNLIAFGVDQRNIETIHPGAAPNPNVSPRAVSEAIHRYVLDDQRVILSVGRLIPRKGHLTLVRALPRVLDTAPNAHLVIVGRGPCLPDIVREARALGVRDRVLLPGRLSDEDVAALYALCDVFALPVGADRHGQVEGFGLVFTEAHAHGKPVVAGRSGGVVDAVTDGETGLLVEPDQPEPLADAIIRLLEDTSLASRLGENGRRRVEAELNWATFTQRLLEAVEARS